MPIETKAVEPQDPEEPYNEKADAIEQCVFALFAKEPNDDRFRLLDEIAYCCEYEFPYLGQELYQGKLSEESKRALMDSPAAPILLAYIVQALLTYNELNSAFWESRTASTATKRAALASAFRLVAKPGESYPDIDSRMVMAFHFQMDFRKALAAEVAKPKAGRKRAAKAARVSALKSMYAREHGQPFDDTDDTHRSRMTIIRRKLSQLCTEDAESQGER